MNPKVKSPAALLAFVQKARRAGKKIVFTNGCFDILHYGHVDYLRKAKKFGDLLVVGMNTDRSVRALKGKGRPVNSQSDRAEILSELCSVDAVTLFGDATPLKLIRRIRPDALVKGADYRLEDIVGRTFVESYGGKVVRIPLRPGRSTTGILQKSRAR
ncbi:MAG: D-glycero-beta-D-manno-heptose 1-phosphate adenylyltransferase [Candidatus Omnitrophica bacterium]|nr:D-glycero-beta-D-manno-heptose 1-phosphate adenylyltransferase [Candidatus Omnitrophota bacterium]